MVFNELSYASPNEDVGITIFNGLSITRSDNKCEVKNFTKPENLSINAHILSHYNNCTNLFDNK